MRLAVTLEETLRDRRMMLLLFRIGFWSSLVLIAVGCYYIVRDLVG